MQDVVPFQNIPYVDPSITMAEASILASQAGGQQQAGNFMYLQVGAGATSFKVDPDGMWLGADKMAEAPFSVDMLGNAVLNSVLISGLSGSTLAGAFDENGNIIAELITSILDTQAGEILGEFTFVGSGALAIKTDANNGLWISPTGILAKKAGANTFALDNAGNATFSGTLTAASGSLGAITIGNNAFKMDSSGNMWWGASATYADATIKISAAGVANLSGLVVGTNVGLGTAKQTFTATPTTPYYVGDLWAGGSSGDLKRCITQRLTGAYNAADWDLASKYTDDSGVTTIVGNTVTTSFVNALNVTANSVAAENITGTTITGKTIKTATTGLFTQLDSNNLRFYDSAAQRGFLRPDSTNGLVIGTGGSLWFTELDGTPNIEFTAGGSIHIKGASQNIRFASGRQFSDENSYIKCDAMFIAGGKIKTEANFVSSDGSDGVDITSMRIVTEVNFDGGGAFYINTRDLTFKDGIVTSISGETKRLR